MKNDLKEEKFKNRTCEIDKTHTTFTHRKIFPANINHASNSLINLNNLSKYRQQLNFTLRLSLRIKMNESVIIVEH